MMLLGLARYWGDVEWPIEVVMAVVAILGAIRRNPGDRVLLFEFLTLASFVLGAFSLKMIGISLLGIVAWLLLFFAFTFLAAYFGYINWRHRRTKTS